MKPLTIILGVLALLGVALSVGLFFRLRELQLVPMGAAGEEVMMPKWLAAGYYASLNQKDIAVPPGLTVEQQHAWRAGVRMGAIDRAG